MMYCVRATKGVCIVIQRVSDEHCPYYDMFTLVVYVDIRALRRMGKEGGPTMYPYTTYL